MKPSSPRPAVCALTFLAVVSLLAWTGCARHSRPNESSARTIAMQGQGNATAMPDKITWRLLIHCDAPSVEAAHSEVLAANSRLMARAKDLGLPKSDFKMTDWRQGANWKWVQGQREPTNTYYSELWLELSIADVSKYPAITDQLFVDNALIVEGVQFKSSKLDELRRQALAAAIADAKSRAEFAAKQLGVTLGPVRHLNVLGRIQVIEAAPFAIQAALQINRTAEALPALHPISVKASVDLSYNIR